MAPDDCDDWMLGHRTAVTLHFAAVQLMRMAHLLEGHEYSKSDSLILPESTQKQDAVTAVQVWGVFLGIAESTYGLHWKLIGPGTSLWEVDSINPTPNPPVAHPKFMAGPKGLLLMH